MIKYFLLNITELKDFLILLMLLMLRWVKIQDAKHCGIISNFGMYLQLQSAQTQTFKKLFYA